MGKGTNPIKNIATDKRLILLQSHISIGII